MRSFREEQVRKRTVKRDLNYLSSFYNRSAIIWLLGSGFGFFHTPNHLFAGKSLEKRGGGGIALPLCTNHPELVCDNAGAKRWMKGQGQRREGTARSKIVHWGRNPGKNPACPVCRVGTCSRARAPEFPYRYWRKNSALAEQF